MSEFPREAPPPYDAKPPPPAGFHLPPSEQHTAPYPTQGAPVIPASPAVYTPVGSTNVVVMQPAARTTHVIVRHEILPPVSTLVTCPSCRQSITTRVDYKAGSRTHLWAILLCLFGCWPCAPLPYCMKSCQSANHYCPNCGAYIGTAL